MTPPSPISATRIGLLFLELKQLYQVFSSILYVNAQIYRRKKFICWSLLVRNNNVTWNVLVSCFLGSSWSFLVNNFYNPLLMIFISVSSTNLFVFVINKPIVLSLLPLYIYEHNELSAAIFCIIYILFTSFPQPLVRKSEPIFCSKYMYSYFLRMQIIYIYLFNSNDVLWERENAPLKM